jgi:hypothetical protein
MSPLVDEFTSVYKHAVCLYCLYNDRIYLNSQITKPVIAFNPAVNVIYKKCIK